MIVLIFVAVCLSTLLYRYTTRNHDYWLKRNVKHDRPLPFFGNHLKNFLVRRTVPEIGVEFYNKYKGEKIVGYYRGNTPELIIRDPEIVRHILCDDFTDFPGRGGFENIANEPLLRNVLFTSGEQWRSLRQPVIFALSKNRLKSMFTLLLECVGKLDSRVERFASQREDVNAYDLMAAYTLECIGSCFFGVELNTIEDRSNFTDLAKSFFVKSKSKMRFMALLELLPEISMFFPYKIVNKELENALLEMTKRAREGRNSKPSGRNDFIDILLEMEVQRKLGNGNPGKDPKKEELDNVKFAAAQLFLFLIGGFETTATAMSTTLHQLAHHPEIQSKIQIEIDQVLSKYDNQLSFDCLSELSQLEMAIKESMRLLAPFGSFRRASVGKYTIPGTDVVIDPGVRVLIPIQALHKDPEYFENPESFCPERFSPEAGKSGKLSNSFFLTFGEGPRKCIGRKMAMMMASAGLATILRRFTVIPAQSSKYRLSVKKTSYLAQIVEGGIPVRFNIRE